MYEEDRDTEARKLAEAVVALGLGVVMMLFYTLAIMLSWNWVVPTLFTSMPKIGWWEAVGLLIIYVVAEWVVKKSMGRLKQAEDQSFANLKKQAGKDVIIWTSVMAACFVIYLAFGA